MPRSPQIGVSWEVGPHARVRRRTERDGPTPISGAGDRGPDRRVRAGGRIGGVVPVESGHPQHHDHQVSVDGKYPPALTDRFGGQVLADATPHELMGDTVFCTSIAGEEIGRILTWGTHPAREADYKLASPSLNCDIPQT